MGSPKLLLLSQKIYLSNTKIISCDIMDNKEKVIKTFKESEEPLNATKVSQISGVEKKEVDKIMKELKKDETIYSPKRCYYALKE